MAVSPIYSTRISLQYQTQSLLEAVRRNQYSSFIQQSRLASGRSFLALSDDPVASSRALRLGEELDRQAQVFENVTRASDVLNATDDALADVNDMLSEAHAIASQNAGSLTLPDERIAAAELIASIREQLITIGNREFDGRHLFAGRDSTEQPFQSLLSGVGFLGDTGDVLVRVSDSDFEAVNLTGDVLFGALSARVIGSVDLDPVVSANTRLDDLSGAGGSGVRTGVLLFNEISGAGVVQVDLTQADTLGDVVNSINQAATDAGAGFTAALSATGIDITPTGELSITDTGTGVIADDLGILTDPPVAAPIIGADLRVRVTRTTPIANLGGGAGLNLADPIRITNGTESKSIDLSSAETVQEVLNEINAAGLGVRAEVNGAGTGIDVINLVSGSQLSISEDGGTTAATLGIRSLDTATTLSSLNHGLSFETAAGEDDIRIIAKDGSKLDVNLDGAGTLGDIIDLINAAAVDAGVALTASMTASGDGWQIEDTTGGGGVITVHPLNNTVTALAPGLDRAADAAHTELVIDDLSTSTGDNVLAALTELEESLRRDDTTAITAAADRLETLNAEITRTRGVVGARAKSMQDRLIQIENANAATETFLADVQDLDYAEAATQFEQAQTALQASLLTGSRAMSISLMDFLA
ncbi:MAG: hypothetical protein GY842_08725 [bacterium]|nr:hypothetical protein [bacterium]